MSSQAGELATTVSSFFWFCSSRCSSRRVLFIAGMVFVAGLSPAFFDTDNSPESFVTGWFAIGERARLSVITLLLGDFSTKLKSLSMLAFTMLNWLGFKFSGRVYILA